jgi:hypothetical protein
MVKKRITKRSPAEDRWGESTFARMKIVKRKYGINQKLKIIPENEL